MDKAQKQRLAYIALLQRYFSRSRDEMLADIGFNRRGIHRQIGRDKGRQTASGAGQQMQRADLTVQHHLRSKTAVGVALRRSRLVVESEGSTKQEKVLQRLLRVQIFSVHFSPLISIV
ncbi:hypothetical protein D3C80_1766070 [compost metagenome]